MFLSALELLGSASSGVFISSGSVSPPEPSGSLQRNAARQLLAEVGEEKSHAAFSESWWFWSVCQVTHPVHVPLVFPSLASPARPPTAGDYCLISGRLGRRLPRKSITLPAAVPKWWRGRRILSLVRGFPSMHLFLTVSEGVCAEAARRVRNEGVLPVAPLIASWLTLKLCPSSCQGSHDQK